MVWEWDTSHCEWVLSHYSYLKDSLVSSADDWAVYIAVGVSWFCVSLCGPRSGPSPLVRIACARRSCNCSWCLASPIGPLYGPQLGLLEYATSSLSCVFFALAALTALGGSLGGCCRLAAPPSSGFASRGILPRPHRLFIWQNRRFRGEMVQFSFQN